MKFVFFGFGFGSGLSVKGQMGAMPPPQNFWLETVRLFVCFIQAIVSERLIGTIASTGEQ